MRSLRLPACLLLLPLALCAADRPLRADPARSYVDVDVQATLDPFTARLDAYEFSAMADDTGRIKTAVLTFRFADLKTGKGDRDAAMLEWLGGTDTTGRFVLGILARTPSGQGQATGNLTLRGQESIVEFPVNVTQADGTWVITGTANLDYRHWGLKIIRKLGVLKVDPQVKVSFKFTAVPQ